MCPIQQCQEDEEYFFGGEAFNNLNVAKMNIIIVT